MDVDIDLFKPMLPWVKSYKKRGFCAVYVLRYSGKQYVGQTKDLYTRFCLWRGEFIERGVRDVEVVQLHLVRVEKSDQLEETLIRELGTVHPSGHNKNSTGQGANVTGWRHTAESKAKISAALKGRKPSIAVRAMYAAKMAVNEQLRLAKAVAKEDAKEKLRLERVAKEQLKLDRAVAKEQLRLERVVAKEQLKLERVVAKEQLDIASAGEDKRIASSKARVGVGAKISAKLKAFYKNVPEGYFAKRTATRRAGNKPKYTPTPETRMLMSEAIKKSYREKKAKGIAYVQSPETRARISASMKKFRASQTHALDHSN